MLRTSVPLLTRWVVAHHAHLWGHILLHPVRRVRNHRVLCGLFACCRSKSTGEQRHATRGAGRLPGLLVGPGPSVNGPEVRHTPWLGEMLGMPPDLYLIRNV
jgi:hypothetical protein